MQRDIHLKWFFPHTVEEVWACLTDSELMGEWLMKNNFKPVVGHKFEFRHKARGGWNGIAYCEVLELLPNEKLVYSWKGGPSDGVITLDSVLTWTLTKTANGTELHLAHTGFKGVKNYFVSFIMEKGWQKIIGRRFTSLLKPSHAA
ncbi:MAG: SRPBCC domain-containing protein [Chitinophagales bacterium]